MTQTAVLLATHLVCVVVGGAGGWWLARAAARSWPDHPHPIKAMETAMRHDVDETTQERHSRETREGVRLGAVILICSMFVLLIGGQTFLEQRNDRADEKRISDAVDRLDTRTGQLTDLIDCIQTWGQDFADVTTTRVGQNAATGTVDLERAEKRRNDALDQIILTVIAFREIPPQADDEDFDRVLTEYAAAIRNLNKVSREVDVTRASNPYPALECDVESVEGTEPKE